MPQRLRECCSLSPQLRASDLLGRPVLTAAPGEGSGGQVGRLCRKHPRVARPGGVQAGLQDGRPMLHPEMPELGVRRESAAVPGSCSPPKCGFPEGFAFLARRALPLLPPTFSSPTSGSKNVRPERYRMGSKNEAHESLSPLQLEGACSGKPTSCRSVPPWRRCRRTQPAAPTAASRVSSFSAAVSARKPGSLSSSSPLSSSFRFSFLFSPPVLFTERAVTRVRVPVECKPRADSLTCAIPLCLPIV